MNNFGKLKRAAAITFAFITTAAGLGIYDNSRILTGSAAEDSQAYSQKLSDLQKQQDELDKEIADAEKQIAKEKDNLEAIQKKYKSLQQKVKSVETSSSELENQMVELDSKMRETMHNLEEQSKIIDSMRQDFMSRIRAMYIAGGTNSYTNVLIDSEDFYDVLMRIELVKRVAKHDNDELNKLMDKKAEIEKIQSELNSQSENLKTAAKEYAEKQKELSKQQEELLKMQEESGAALNKLENNKEQLEAQSREAADEYARISKNAETTASKSSEMTKTTTKKTSDGSSGKETSSAETTQPPRTESNVSNTTSSKKTTTQKPQTTAPVTNSNPAVPDRSKADIVVSYAKSMVGGSYVWAGESFGATDCSGLIMLSYRQVGINLPHYAASQANYGTVVSYSDMQPGDVIFFGGSSYSSIYHVAMYIGDGKMVHAENSYTGIVISSVASFSQYNNITVIKRLL